VRPLRRAASEIVECPRHVANHSQEHVHRGRLTLRGSPSRASERRWQWQQRGNEANHIHGNNMFLTLGNISTDARRPALCGVRFGNHAPAHGASAHPLGSRGLPRAGGGGASGRGRDRRGRGDSRPGSVGLALRRLLTLQFGRASRPSARAAGTPRARAGRASGSGGIPSPAQFRARWPPDRRPSATAVRHCPILGKPRAATRGTRRRPRRGRSDCGG
jgi:hypothetical protein